MEGLQRRVALVRHVDLPASEAAALERRRLGAHAKVAVLHTGLCRTWARISRSKVEHIRLPDSSRHAAVLQAKQWSHVTAPQANEKMARNTFMVYLTTPLSKPAPSPLPPAQQQPQAAATAAA